MSRSTAPLLPGDCTFVRADPPDDECVRCGAAPTWRAVGTGDVYADTAVYLCDRCLDAHSRRDSARHRAASGASPSERAPKRAGVAAFARQHLRPAPDATVSLPAIVSAYQTYCATHGHRTLTRGGVLGHLYRTHGVRLADPDETRIDGDAITGVRPHAFDDLDDTDDEDHE